jgi:tRNA (guanine-N7-)-methyltransferase
MPTWENQYIQLVTTKPERIIAEKDRQSPIQSRQLITEMRQQYQGVFVEIGSGSGLHLIELAKQNPHILCVGLEIRFKRAFKTGEKADRLGLSNALVIRSDARYIREIFNPGDVAAFFVNYPDPWDKRRWKKNRILNEEMLECMHSLLSEGGFLRYKTDHHEYFHSTSTLICEPQWQVRKHSTDLLNSEWAADNIPTEFEYLFKSQGKQLCLLEALKVPHKYSPSSKTPSSIL